MITLLDPKPGDRVLEIAAGPGETGFELVPLIRPGGTLISTDAAHDMVEAARRRAVELGLADVEFAVEDAAALSLESNSVHGVLCRFGIMLVPDMERVSSEIARVLRPGGAAVLAVWASTRMNPWMTAPGRAALELGLTEPPDPDTPGPFRLANVQRLEAVITSGGLELETVEDVPVAWVAESLDEWWETTCDTSRMLTTLLSTLTARDAVAVRRSAERHLAEYVRPDGSVAVPGLARVVLARAG